VKPILMLSNGPGELWGWVRPLSRELSSRGASITLALLPCQFASGEELNVAENLGTVDEIIAPSTLAGTVRAMNGAGKKCSIVFQLGGDLLWGRMASRAGRVPLLCYTYGRKSGTGRCDRVYTAFDAMAGNIGPVQVTGDLVLDSLEMDGSLPRSGTEEKQARTIAFFPGSRPSIRKFTLPFLREMGAVLRRKYPSCELRAVVSPFAPSSEDQAWRDAGFIPACRESALKGVDFAVTQPGTNTLELMHLGIPFLVLVPFSSLRNVPVSGIAGLIAGMPLAGPMFREWALKRKGARAGFLAWPNRIAGRAVVEEMVGDFSPVEAAERVSFWIDDFGRRESVRSSLAELSASAPRGAAKRIADEMEKEILPV
jgi:hypothetical protein